MTDTWNDRKGKLLHFHNSMKNKANPDSFTFSPGLDLLCS